MSVIGISQIHISVSAIEEAVVFYRDVLGLEFLFDVPDQQMAFFDLNGVRIYLGAVESAEFASAPLLYFDVEDIHSETKRLIGAGVETLGEPHVIHKTETSELWMAFFKTPDGHVNALTEERPI